MAELQRSDGEALALSGAAAGPGVPIPVTYVKEWTASANRAMARLADAVAPAAAMEVYADDTAALRIGVRAGEVIDGDTEYSYAGCANQAVVDASSNYVYLTLADLAAGNTVTINQTGFPLPSATPHIPLAVVTAAGGAFAIANITAYTSRSLLRVLAGMTAGNANTLADGSNADALHIHAAAGITDACLTDAKMAVRFVQRPATAANGAVYFSGRPADGELLTIGGRTYEYDSNSSYPDSAGDVQVDANAAASAADDVLAFVDAINNDVDATVEAWADDTTLWINALTAGAAGNAISLATGLANTTVSHAHLVDGQAAAAVGLASVRHVVTAEEATAGAVCVDTGLASILSAVAAIEDGGVLAAVGGVITYADPYIKIAEGTPTWTAGDAIVVWAMGTTWT